MVSLLLDDKAGIVLTGQEEMAMIEILSCAVRRAVGSGIPPARTRGKVSLCHMLLYTQVHLVVLSIQVKKTFI